MKITLRDINDFVNGSLVGDPDLVITGINGLDNAASGDLACIANPKFESGALTTKASVLMVALDADVNFPALIRVKNPLLAFGKVVDKFFSSDDTSLKGIHPLASIDEEVVVGKNVSIGPYAIIEKGVVIGDDTRIFGGAYISCNVTIGSHCIIHSNVNIKHGSCIGNNVIIHCGAVIGSDGFGFEKINGQHQKIPQVGIVVIEDDVELGANVTIDRARFDKTIVGRGSKIDNLVHIAHNVVIGENCIIIAQVGISGSVTVGRDVVLAGQVGVVGHINIADGTVVASKSAIMKSTEAHSLMWGIPALPHMQQKRNNVLVQRLPKLVEKIKILEEKVKRLESEC